MDDLARVKLIDLENNILTRGTEGAILQLPDFLEGAGIHGYI